jgi:hypothetical protein
MKLQAVYDASGGSYAPPGPSVDATNTSLATPSTQLERNPFFPTLQVREDVNYDQNCLELKVNLLNKEGRPLHRKQSIGHLKLFTTGLLTRQASRATCRAARAWSRSVLT